jgi:hypothetical protein
VYDALQTPFGMVRFGVAPDHPKIKSVTRVYEKTARHPGFRFFGGVRLGEHVTRAELLERYHAVVYAYGTVTDNRLGIPGEGRPGSHSATDNRRARVATSRLPPPYAAHTETTFAQLCPQTNTPYSHPLGRIRAAVDTRRVTEHDSCESGRLARPRTRASGRTSWKRPRRDPADARSVEAMRKRSGSQSGRSVVVPGGSVGDPDPAFVGCRFAMEQQSSNLVRVGPENWLCAEPVSRASA